MEITHEGSVVEVEFSDGEMKKLLNKAGMEDAYGYGGRIMFQLEPGEIVEMSPKLSSLKEDVFWSVMDAIQYVAIDKLGTPPRTKRATAKDVEPHL